MTLTEAIVVRISHDLAGAVGALSNTLDLVKMDASFLNESGELLDNTSRCLTARLAFFRALFGAETKSVDTSILTKYLETLAIPVAFKGTISSRLELALVAAGLEILGTGGSITLNDKTVIVSGKDLHHDPVFVQALMGTNVPCDPKFVTALWLVQIAKEEDLIIRLDAGENTITLSLT
ncbi:MAG: hypothetical protein II942_04820 [Alphaproteobacteria bacterium]|nr:hypothetical protein [Alphaproteobacteria bacterium]